MKPEPEHHGDADAEQDGQHAASSRVPADKSSASSQRRHAGVDQGNPGPPGLTEHFAVLEAQLEEQQRDAAEHRRCDALVARFKDPGGSRSLRRFRRPVRDSASHQSTVSICSGSCAWTWSVPK
jgi:hypothetical protein